MLMRQNWWQLVAVVLFALPVQGGWFVLPATDARTGLPSALPKDAKPIAVGDKWPDDKRFRWLVGELQVPARINGKAVDGLPVGLQFNCGDGGEMWFDGKIQTRYDNDHPGLALIAKNAKPGEMVRIACEVYGKVQGGDHFSEAAWVFVEPKRVDTPLTITVDASHELGAVPNGIIGLSQGGGMCDYEDATAKKLKEGGFRWFRMDNILTGVVKRDAGGTLSYDWKDLDRRVDFIRRIGAEPVFAASYMPQVFDAVPDPDRHSAPSNFQDWEELCYQAARHCVERGTPVPRWEVWNEVNAGWLKPGPHDTGSSAFANLYQEALGKPEKNADVVRRFEAYCRLYRATARGVRRADPSAKIGGPVLASGPFENGDKGGPGSHGRGFARGLFLFCAREKLPLDFVSWHEYFQASDVISAEVREMRRDLSDLPQFADAAHDMMLTEWNEAWWPDRPCDHELGAAWCADCVTRCFIPDRLQRPCLFYVKQNDSDFRGDWSILMRDNVPKATFNMAKVFNSLRGRWVSVRGGDDEVSAVAAWDPSRKTLDVVLVNFRYRYDLRRSVSVHCNDFPSGKPRRWRRWTVDATHSNVWNDPSHAELQVTGSEDVGTNEIDQVLEPNSVTLLEFSNESEKVK